MRPVVWQGVDARCHQHFSADCYRNPYPCEYSQNIAKLMKTDQPVSVVHIASGDLWAGAEVQLATLVRSSLRQELGKVRVILLNHGRLQNELEAAGAEVTVLDEHHHGTFSLVQRITALLRSWRPDIVHTHRLKENVIGAIAAQRNNIPSLRSVHGASEHKPAWFKPRNVIYQLDRFCGHRLQSAVVAVTSELSVKLRGEFPADKIRVIENGIDTSLAVNSERTETNTIDIGIIGRLVPVKRVDLFIECASLLLQRKLPSAVKFHVYGDGPLEQELKLQASSLSLAADKLEFHGHSDTIQDDMNRLDILLMCSDHEGLPMTLLEAMLLQTAVVAHDVGGMTEVLEHGNCGLLVKQHHATAYADALESCIMDSESTSRRVSNANKRVREVYSAEANAQKFHQLYLELK